MDYGKPILKDKGTIDFSPDANLSGNSEILPGKAVAHPKVYVGCSHWGRKEWVGSLYPPATAEKDFLSLYTRRYNSIELNATHYKIYDELTINKWLSATGHSNFLFCPKMFKGISHFGSLAGKEEITKEFLHSLSFFKDHLGPLFIQLSEKFGPERKEELFKFLETLPRNTHQFFLELRHPGWYSDIESFADTCARLKKLKIGFVITDTEAHRDIIHMTLTVPKAFVRLQLNGSDGSDYQRMDSWAEIIKTWLHHGLEELYFFIHVHDESCSPAAMAYMTEKLNSECGLDLQVPQLLKTLF